MVTSTSEISLAVFWPDGARSIRSHQLDHTSVEKLQGTLYPRSIECIDKR